MEKVGFSTAEEADAILHAILSGADTLISGEFWKMTGDQLLDLGRRLEVLSRKVWAAQVHLVDELNLDLSCGACGRRSGCVGHSMNVPS